MIGRGDLLALLILGLAILWFTHVYLNPTVQGLPEGIDIGDDLAYLGVFRSELLDSGRLLTWWNVAYDGIPLLGHPNTQVFYPPLMLPTLAFGTMAGTRIAYVFSLLLAGTAMFILARMFVQRPAVAAWAGLVFAMGGGFAARINAGHLQKVLAMPLIPLVIAGAFMIGRANTHRGIAFWGFLTGMTHGFTFLAGESFLQVYLFAAVVIILVINNRGDGSIRVRNRFVLGMATWGAGMVFATAGKLLAAISVLAETTRNVDPFAGSQHAYWAVVHLAFPFFRYGAGQITWGYGGWEYTQYIGFIPMVLAAVAISTVLVRVLNHPNSVTTRIRTAEAAALCGVGVMSALWLANEFWYSPVHWMYVAVPGLDNYRVPSRALMLAVPVTLALGAVGLELALRLDTIRAQIAAVVVGGMAVIGIWYVNTPYLSPAHWFFAEVLKVPESPLIILALVLGFIAVLVAGAIVYLARNLILKHRHRIFPLVLAGIAVMALLDVYHATSAIPKVGSAPSAPQLRRIIQVLQERESLPFRVGIGKFNPFYWTAARFEFADQGISVTRQVSPLVPKHRKQHHLIGPEFQVRYWVAPSWQEPWVDGQWQQLMDDGDVRVHFNGQAKGDAWLVVNDDVQPVGAISVVPGKFVIRTAALPGAKLVVPANAFDGWKVSIDGGPHKPTVDFDGFAATETLSGEHTYELIYKEPMLPLVLILGALPWLFVIALLVWALMISFRRSTPAEGSTGI